jgi:hypothetical protein
MEHRRFHHKLFPSHIVPDTVHLREALEACPRHRTVRDGFLYWIGGDRGKYL